MFENRLLKILQPDIKSGDTFNACLFLTPYQILLYGPLRWTTRKLISLICVQEKIFKRKHFSVK